MKLSRGKKRFLWITVTIVALFIIVTILTIILTGFVAGLQQAGS
ncbi:hypothetical protein [Alicyclobacillus acidoterrestris]|nr:hypothetical protein [Alicyclobacillus acidoterrestris]EPZ48137.1 hypothetical protein N007_04595 [Alicyclobacillus acidoterrestris ATCC 49025]